jgi:hypothetical protein
MFFHGAAVYQNVIKINHHKFPNESPQSMEVLGALVKPKGTTNHSYKPNFVLRLFSIHRLASS